MRKITEHYLRMNELNYFSLIAGFTIICNISSSLEIDTDNEFEVIDKKTREIVINAADFLVKNQNKDGTFTYEIDIANNNKSKSNNGIRQLATTWIIGQFGRLSGEQKYTDSADESIKFWLKSCEFKNNNFIVIDNTSGKQKSKLGHLAFLLLSMLETDKEKYQNEIQRLVKSILSLQKTDGSFTTYIIPPEKKGGEDYYPGEALLALVTYLQYSDDEQITNSISSAFKYYTEYFSQRLKQDSEPPSAFIPWQSRAFSRFYSLSKNKEHAEFVFKMTDWLLQFQGENGGFFTDPSSNSTATYTEGICEAFRLAKELNDKARIHKYETAIQKALYFVNSHQITDKQYKGGFLFTGNSIKIRIDTIQHAVSANILYNLYK
ncbi:MAG: terpene cyclase/mutase family protein [Planctomycetes bacterium]|nr:terpene cyclase/mutase family protein [Planctomycetota bacterium]